MSLLTNRLADKEKKIEEYKADISTLNSSYETLKHQIGKEQQKLAAAQDENRHLREMINFILQSNQHAALKWNYNYLIQN